MGIADFAIRIPTGELDLVELSRRSGLTAERIRTVVPSGRLSTLTPDQEIWDLGRDAARTLLERTEVAPHEVDLVLYAGGADWGRPFWSPAAKIAHEVGVPHAFCSELSNFCNAGMAAIAMADDLVRLGRHRNALVVVADPLSRLVDHSGDLLELFNFADAAAAVLLTADERSRYRVLGSAMRTDPQWVDYYYGTGAGGEVTIQRAGKRDGLGQAFTDNFTTLTRRVLHDVGRAVMDVDWVLVTHGNQDLHRDYLKALGVAEDRSVFNYDRDGHLGGVDPLLALQDLEDTGRARPDDLILVATAGSGFTWGITALQVV